MPFNVSGAALVKKIDPRKGTSDDSHVSIAVKLRVEDVPAANITAALGAESAEDVETALFKPASVDADRNTRFLGLKSIACEASWEGKHTIKFFGLREVRVAKVGTIQIRPRGYCKCDVTFVVVIDQPPQGYLEQLSESINKALRVDLTHDKELFDDVPPANDPEAAPNGARGRRGTSAKGRGAGRKRAKAA